MPLINYNCLHPAFIKKANFCGILEDPTNTLSEYSILLAFSKAIFYAQPVLAYGIIIHRQTAVCCQIEI